MATLQLDSKLQAYWSRNPVGAPAEALSGQIMYSNRSVLWRFQKKDSSIGGATEGVGRLGGLSLGCGDSQNSPG